MKQYTYKQLSDNEKAKLCTRKSVDLEKIIPIVKNIQTDILKKGDIALSALSKKFDGVVLEKFSVKESPTLMKQWNNIDNLVDESFKKALDMPIDNITTFHQAQAKNLIKEPAIETTKGVTCWRESRPIETVGLYIPGGTAPLFSTILMTVIPAQIAGVSKIILCTPPNPDPAILYTAKKLRLSPENIFQIGGAQAILAMAHGTEQVPMVDKIFGPGNGFVMAAKILATERVAIDMPAGPSEVLVIADKEANPIFVAADILSQAEHGPDSQSVLVTDSEDLASSVLVEIEKQLSRLPRQEIAQKSLENSYILVTENLTQVMDFSNQYAPEHLILNIDQNHIESLSAQIKNAGSVFVGSNACESFGDYASGTNHVLPTSGFARSFSGVSVDSFIKKITFQSITDEGVQNLGPAVEILAEREDLHAHKEAVTVRLKSIKNEI